MRIAAVMDRRPSLLTERIVFEALYRAIEVLLLVSLIDLFGFIIHCEQDENKCEDLLNSRQSRD